MEDDIFESISDALKPLKQRQKEYLEAYGYDLLELTGYVYESYINGQKKQAKEIWGDIMKLFDTEEIQNALFESIIQIGIVKFCTVAAKLEINRTLVVNSIYDNDWINFDKYQTVINAVYDEYLTLNEEQNAKRKKYSRKSDGLA